MTTVYDNEHSLWLKLASSWYDIALDNGATGLNPPRWNDGVVDLMKKVTYYTATLAS